MSQYRFIRQAKCNPRSLTNATLFLCTVQQRLLQKDLFLKKIIIIICLVMYFLAMLALHCCYGPSPVAVKSGHSSLLCMGPRTQTQQHWHRGSAAPQHMESFPTRDRTHIPCTRGTREVPVFICLPQGTWKTASAQEYTTLRTFYCIEHHVLAYSTSQTNAHSIPYHLDYSKCSQPIIKGASNNDLKLTYTHNYI